MNEYDWINDILTQKGFVFAGFDDLTIEEKYEKISMSGKPLIFLASRWVYKQDGTFYCTHRCIGNWKQFWNEIVSVLGNKYYIIGGELSSLQFQTQYHFMRSIDCLITMHGATQAWSIVMAPNSYMFEISIPNWWTGLHWARMLNLKYDEYRCAHCCNGCKGSASVAKNIINVKTAVSKIKSFLNHLQ